MQCPTFTNVYWDLNIKNSAANGGLPEPGAPCHGITSILVNPAICIIALSMRTEEAGTGSSSFKRLCNLSNFYNP